MANIVGWIESLKTEKELVVLAEDNLGKLIVYIGSIDSDRDIFSYGDAYVPYSPEETVIRNGRQLNFREAVSYFPDLVKKNYANC